MPRYWAGTVGRWVELEVLCGAGRWTLVAVLIVVRHDGGGGRLCSKRGATGLSCETQWNCNFICEAVYEEVAKGDSAAAR